MGRPREVSVLPQALKAWRKERGWSQKDLAFHATEKLPDGDSISPTLIALVETGERQPSLRNAEAIAAAFGIDVAALAVVHVNGEVAA